MDFIFRAITILTVARFQQLGLDGFMMMKNDLGILHAECSTTKKAVSMVVYYGYTLLGMANIHASKG